MNVDFAQGLRDARERLGRAWPAAGAALALLFVAVVGALEGQAIGSPASARAVQLRLLQGVAFGLVLPLFAYAAAARTGGRAALLMRAAWGRHGGHRQLLALGSQALAALLAGAVTAGAGVLALALGSATAAAGSALPPSAANLVSVVWIGLLGGLAYGACFALAQLVAGAPGRMSLLALDGLLGSGTGLLALPWPRAHLRTLLGGEAPLGLGATEAALCLVAIALLAVGAFLRRVPP